MNDAIVRKLMKMIKKLDERLDRHENQIIEDKKRIDGIIKYLKDRQ
jgi:hypothetical protein